MVAYHFPPLAGSSGIQRTLRFVQHLPSFGWEPLVLTTKESAYERTSKDQLQDIPPNTVVRRAFALDAARHLSIGGRYIGATARPDRWVSWRFDGVRQGLKLIREMAPLAIWSTYPFATAHSIGGELARRTGLPWIADFRDPMAQPEYPTDPITRAQFLRIEADVVRHANLSVFTTPSAADEYRRRYPEVAHRIVVVENGYDEETFIQANEMVARGPLHAEGITLLHSGIVYPSERDPSQLIRALQLLHESGRIRPGQFRIRFRASAADGLLQQLAQAHAVQPYVELMPPVPYREALAEMLRADALLILQAANCNQQIPAKLYEYLRSGRPIVCLSDAAGDTWRTLAGAGLTHMAALDDPVAIAALLEVVVAETGRCAVDKKGMDLNWAGFLPDATAIAAASRKGRTQQLVEMLGHVVLAHKQNLHHA